MKYYASYTPVESGKKYKKTLFTKLLETLFFLGIIAIFCYVVFCAFFIKARVIGVSMQPTFNKNLSVEETDMENSKYRDFAFANRYDKGGRGDIVLIDTTETNGEEQTIIKRIIATQYDQLTLKRCDDGFYYYFVNGNKLEESYLKENRKFMDLNYYLTFCETTKANEIVENEEAEIEVPKDKFFFLGDNRKEKMSVDSATYYGCYDSSKILGKVWFSYDYDQNFFGFVWEQIKSVF